LSQDERKAAIKELQTETTSAASKH
jgi:hypothetical protein